MRKTYYVLLIHFSYELSNSVTRRYTVWAQYSAVQYSSVHCTVVVCSTYLMGYKLYRSVLIDWLLILLVLYPCCSCYPPVGRTISSQTYGLTHVQTYKLATALLRFVVLSLALIFISIFEVSFLLLN